MKKAQMSEADSYFALGEALEEAAKRTKLAPKKKKETLSGFINNSEWLEAVDRGMMAMDPLVHFSVTAACPACGNGNTYVIDLEHLLLNRLHSIQRHLFHTIHRLAGFYHWSEAQIMAVSPRRRAYYLSLIDDRDSNLPAGELL